MVELGSHDELMARGGRYRTMFDLQAQRFATGPPRRTRRRWSMTSSPDDDRAVAERRARGRRCRRRCRRCGGCASSATSYEPRLMGVAFVLSLSPPLPDALFALWLKLLGDGRCRAQRGLYTRARGLGVSAVATWFLSISRPGCSGASATG